MPTPLRVDSIKRVMAVKDSIRKAEEDKLAKERAAADEQKAKEEQRKRKKNRANRSTIRLSSRIMNRSVETEREHKPKRILKKIENKDVAKYTKR